MNVWPVIGRELRTEGRQGATYWLRVTACFLVIAVFMVIFLGDGLDIRNGAYLFVLIHNAINLVIWVVIPLTTADCLARERREGTLGLLFLTPLTSSGVITGKSFVHLLRASSVVLCVFPLVSICLLIGGVSGSDIIRSLTLQFATVFLALAASILSSVRCSSWTRALILAYAFEIFGLLLVTVASPSLRSQDRSVVEQLTRAGGFMGEMDMLDAFGDLNRQFPFNQSPTLPSTGPGFSVLIGYVSKPVICLLLLALVILLAARHLKSSWQAAGLTERQRWLLKNFCTPVFLKERFRKKMSGTLSRNPVGWLQQYSWSSRVAKWTWCGLGILIFSWACIEHVQRLDSFVIIFSYALLASLAFSSVASFQREKQNGAFELLLVTPLREAQIIFGRLRGIWVQFTPALLVAAVVVVVTWELQYADRFEVGRRLATIVSSFLVLPVVGMYLALSRLGPIAAWLTACSIGFILPWILSYVLVAALWMLLGFPLGSLMNFPMLDIVTFGTELLLLAAAGIAFGLALFRRLRSRSFLSPVRVEA